ncbi:ABC transporter ATP-binding protein [Dasania marina]|uniref:ABC transporter ATP-binding protein n=1 Tax=Dasania marina TaxID=471499 RepID=UPI0030D77661|tara:strand:- start:92299 stop:94116 length:1818 start_codon:yes stop_codon:yes gene_type:complete
MYILSVIKNTYRILDKKSQKKFITLQVFFAFSAIIQVAGVASLAPFIAILSNPEIIHSNSILSEAYASMEFTSNINFMIAFASLSILLVFFANFISAISLWLLLRFSIYFGCTLQGNLYACYLDKSYLYHKENNYSQLIANISSEAPRFIYMVLQSTLTLTSQLFIAIIILSGLLFLDPALALTSGLLIGCSYALTYAIVKNKLISSGNKITSRNKNIQSILSESFIGIKDLKLNGQIDHYKNKFNSSNKSGLTAMTFISLAGDIPRYVIETICLCAILAFSIFLLLRSNSFDHVITMVSLYALAGYKLLPTMQQIYKSISSISANGTVTDTLLQLLNSLNHPINNNNDIDLEFKIDSIDILNLSFSYPNTDTPTLKNINCSFKKGHIYAVAGESGSGKSTLADCILGLLPLSSGEIVANTSAINKKTIASYQSRISYVSQQTFITDDNIINNVAFGYPGEKIDKSKVIDALKLAQAYNFVAQLPKGLETQLGQDGKLLSGGQRQRIAIARALYKKSDVLILDEPTSALDMTTEYDFLETINALKKNFIIIVISHRPASVKMSDFILLVDNGSLIATAPYFELIKNNNKFKLMVTKGSGDQLYNN